MRQLSKALIVVLILSLLSPTFRSQAAIYAEPLPPDPLQALQAQSGDDLTIEYHSETGMVRFIGADLEHPIEQNLGEVTALAQDAPAMAFLKEYGALFGIQDAGAELTLMKSEAAESKQTFTRYQQVYQGIPVMGAEIMVQTLPSGAVLAASGEFLPDIEISIDAQVSAEDARATAMALVAKGYSIDEAGLVSTEPELWIYNPAIVGGPQLRHTSLVWRMEITTVDLAPVRELVLVDAQAGMVLLHFNQVDTALSLATYDAGNYDTLPGTFVCNQANPNCTGGDAHAIAAHMNAADAYNFYASVLERNSIDNAGMTIISTVHYDLDYANAYWDGDQMVYGDYYGFPLADDVVAHELTHGVTGYESGLFYYYQSGAINEALSDIFGEMVDQWNGRGDDSAGVRWLMGEDVSGLGAIRSMSNPPDYSNPDKMTSELYECRYSYDYFFDNGGVHTNSGVANKAAYLMIDGGTFNGQTVTGIGLIKAAHIWYSVQRYLLTSGADYQDLATALPAACTGLVGNNGITTTDCDQVKKAVAAVEMSSQPTSTSCQLPVAATCPTGLSPMYLFKDNLEDEYNGNWSYIEALGDNYWFEGTVGYANSGLYSLWGYDDSQRGDYSIILRTIYLPPGQTAYFRFNHAYMFEYSASAAYDGGLVEYSVGGGDWTDAGPLMDSGDLYNVTLYSGSGNPISGSSAFGADSAGYVSTRVNLSGFAGQNINFRFRIGTDYGGSATGWLIDDVSLYYCIDPSLYPERIYLPYIRKSW